jgi:excisionase family DNA binding protein
MRAGVASDTRSDAELAALLSDPVIAALVLRAVVRDLTDAVRLDGVSVSPRCRRLLSLLYAAARPRELAANGKDHDPAETIEITGTVTVAQLAEQSGHSPRTLRHWAATGRVRAHRAGRTWLIDPESLKEGAA